MKALSVKQPFAFLLGDGLKSIELRGWMTDHRGALLICASASPRNAWWNDEIANERRQLHAGCTIAVVDLVECRRMKKSDEEAACAEFTLGAWAWVFEEPRWVRPERVRGALGLFDVDNALVKPLEFGEWIFDYPTVDSLVYKKGDPLLG